MYSKHLLPKRNRAKTKMLQVRVDALLLEEVWAKMKSERLKMVDFIDAALKYYLNEKEGSNNNNQSQRVPENVRKKTVLDMWAESERSSTPETSRKRGT